MDKPVANMPTLVNKGDIIGMNLPGAAGKTSYYRVTDKENGKVYGEQVFNLQTVTASNSRSFPESFDIFVTSSGS